MYNISKGRDQEALNLIEKVYHQSEDRNDILESLKSQCDTSNKKGESMPYFEALFGPQYIKATLVCIVITSLVQ